MKAEVQEEQASKEIERDDHRDHQDELLWMKKSMTMWEDSEENSQGKAPRTFEAPVFRWRVQKKRKEKKWKRKKRKKKKK